MYKYISTQAKGTKTGTKVTHCISFPLCYFEDNAQVPLELKLTGLYDRHICPKAPKTHLRLPLAPFKCFYT